MDNKIIELLKSNQYTQGEIADIAKCNIARVVKLAKKYGVQIGRGRRPSSIWRFTGMTPELAYIIGAYLTDGNIGRSYKTKHIRQFNYTNTHPEILDHLEKCFRLIGLSVKKNIINSQQMVSKKGNQTQYKIFVYNSMFSTWLDEACKGKDIIPDSLINSHKCTVLAFLAGIIDGDGSVAKDGSIRIRVTSGWIHQMPNLLKKQNIKTNGVSIERILESGKPYYTLNIHRGDYRDAGGIAYHSIKQDRIQNGKDNRQYKDRKIKYYTCPSCGIERMARKRAKQCQRCYVESDEIKERLRGQASKAGIIGNKVRWG